MLALDFLFLPVLTKLKVAVELKAKATALQSGAFFVQLHVCIILHG